MSEVKIYDTTLRDGAQTEGISYSLNDKMRIAEQLDSIGIHYIEGGFPSNTKDRELFKALKKKPLKNSCLVAFGATRYPHKKAGSDANIKCLLDTDTRVITLFGKSWDLHLRDVLKTSLDENLRMISDSIAYIKSKKREVVYDAEHFFDAFKANASYAVQTLKAAQDAGASVLVLCDTNGGTLTTQLLEIIKKVKAQVSVPLGIHTHNDCNLAVANSIVAVQEGCVQVQGTFNGYGERCGNADLVSVIAIIKTKLGIDCISDKYLKELTKTAHFISVVSNMQQLPYLPFAGRSAFAH